MKRNYMKLLFVNTLILIGVLISFTSRAQFITKWRITGSNEVITIPTIGSGYNYIVNWGDGNSSAATGDVSHTYTGPGIYMVSITGTFPRIYFNSTGVSKDKIIEISQWGTNPWESMSSAFDSCTNLNITATDAPVLSGVNDMSSMFYDCEKLNPTGAAATALNSWHTDAVTKLDNTFFGATVFNQKISNWNTANVTDMEAMFWGATAFNQDIGNWNTANVTNMKDMFYEASAFNQDIGHRNTANVLNMEGMFYEATSFNQDIDHWNTARVTNMFAMFEDAIAFNQDIGHWNTAKVTNMRNMFLFFGATAFNQNIGNWNTANVTDMGYMFYGATAFNQDIGHWNTAKVTVMGYMFLGATAFNQNIGHWNTAKVIDMYGMFWGATAFNQDLGNWKIAYLSDMTYMLDNSGLSVANYDRTLIDWAAQAPPPILRLSAGGLKYCAGADARSKLISTYGWAIYSDSLFCTLPAEPKVFPNPTTGQVRIINITIGDEILLTDVMGRKLLKQLATNETQMLNISSMAQGIYLISIFRNGKIVITKKITKLN